MNAEIPAGVGLASTCLAVGGVLLFLLSPGMIITGLFASFHGLLAGLLFLGLGILGMSASTRIDKRRPSSRMCGLIWGGVVATGHAAMMFEALQDPEFDMAAAIIPTTFAVLAVCVLVSLLLPSTSRWLAAPKETAGSSGRSG
jgi:hypothetical protein